MKVWVITKSFDDADIVIKVYATPEGAVRWIAEQCGCELRHDLFAAELPEEVRTPLPIHSTPEDVEAWRLRWRAWSDRYCRNDYGVEEWQVDE